MKAPSKSIHIPILFLYRRGRKAAQNNSYTASTMVSRATVRRDPQPELSSDTPMDDVPPKIGAISNGTKESNGTNGTMANGTEDHVLEKTHM